MKNPERLGESEAFEFPPKKRKRGRSKFKTFLLYFGVTLVVGGVVVFSIIVLTLFFIE